MSAPGPTLFWDVDTQVDFMRESGCLYVPEAEGIIPNLAQLSAAADRFRLPVVASACDHEAGDDEISAEPDFEQTFPPHCMRGTPGVERIPETERDWSLVIGHEPLAEEALAAGLAATPPRVLIHKKEFDVFTNPNTERVLEAIRPARVVVYGVALDVCDRAAVEGLLARGYGELTVVSDATQAIRSERGEELLRGWSERGVAIRQTGEVLSDLEAAAG